MVSSTGPSGLSTWATAHVFACAAQRSPGALSQATSGANKGPVISLCHRMRSPPSCTGPALLLRRLALFRHRPARCYFIFEHLKSIESGPLALHILCDVLCCAVLCCAVLCCVVLCCVVLCCVVLCCVVLCCVVLCCVVLCCVVLCCVVLSCLVLCCPVLCCLVLCCLVLCCLVLCCVVLSCVVLSCQPKTSYHTTRWCSQHPPCDGLLAHTPVSCPCTRPP